MEDSQLPHSVTRNSQEALRLGFLGKAFVGIGALASGLGAEFLYVNKKLFNNLAHGLYATAESNLEAAMTHLSNATKNAVPGSKEEQFKRLIDSLFTPKLPRDTLRHSHAVRKDLRDANTFIGKGLDDARKTDVGERALAKIEFGRRAQLDWIDFISQHPEPTRRGNHALMDEFERRRLASEVGIITTLESRETLAKETVRHVPWLKKVSLSGIQLTRGQKIGAGVVFATVSGIAACGFYRIAQWFTNKQDGEQLQK